ncbi:unnamed protein product [Haemonchus placei]|uniref:Uncharacterized protein n=1 Tax=Haemonchus placei TaxID=6290 RepID=A0A0N4WMN1_HAEPC|nr:unnamed protein product [Haemonchus placei]
MKKTIRMLIGDISSNAFSGFAPSMVLATSRLSKSSLNRPY